MEISCTGGMRWDKLLMGGKGRTNGENFVYSNRYCTDREKDT
jgi:hypothetical protein